MSFRYMLSSLLVMTLTLTLAACKKKPPSEQPLALQGGAGSPGALTGKVLETMDSGGYTYIKLSSAAGEKWAAVRKTKVKKGSQVTIGNAMEMKNFKSKTLDRVFASIYFGTLGGAGGMGPHGKLGPHGKQGPHGKLGPHGGMGGMGGAKQTMAAAHAKLKHGKQVAKAIAKAPGPDGKTVAQIYEGRGALKGKNIAVQGQVTKFNAGIMGRNWVHLQDGTGTAEGGDYDLTVTTKEQASVGDVVIARGKLNTDRDFGAGYTYSVILEDAKLEKR